MSPALKRKTDVTSATVEDKPKEDDTKPEGSNGTGNIVPSLEKTSSEETLTEKIKTSQQC